MPPTSDAIAAHRLALPANVNPITTAFSIKLNATFSMIVRTTRRPMSTMKRSLFKSESMRVTSAVSIASAAPSPMATDTSASANAGASFTPSPTITTALFAFQTFFFASFSFTIASISVSLSSGRRSLFMSPPPRPICPPIPMAVERWSPVRMLISMPILCSDCTTSLASSRTLSATTYVPTMPSPSMLMNPMVPPFLAQSSVVSDTSFGKAS
mmetsp:Transcript_3198/g.4782  ORF Transcript_3198/g.4782 Transcript_3198/m.4782 type:complete len:213 (-) Transcript_3198:462-1100(-)